MRRLTLITALGAAVSTLALISVAAAADMPVKAKAPPLVGYEWTGFYLGGYYGTAIGHSKATTPDVNAGTHDHNQTGITVGLTAGYNWQFDPKWLVGLEGDFGYLGGDRTDTDWDDNEFAGVKTSWYGTARARFGYVTGPSLLYVTGGAAFVHIQDTFGSTGLAPVTGSATKVGGTFGGGIETKLSQSWTAKSEYLYIDAGNVSFLSPVQTNFSHSFHVIKTGLNYKFGGPSEGLPFFSDRMLPSNHNWAGFYVGVNAGLGISNVRTIGGEGTVPFNTEQDVVGAGFAGGGQAGYNFMLTPKYFVGVEGDIGYLGLNHGDGGWNDADRIFTDKTSWYGTARARFGTSTGPALLYFTGGAAFVHLTDRITTSGLAAEASKTAGGWTFGGGAEVALDAMWSARFETLYMDVGKTRLDIGSVNTEFKDRFTVVRAGLSYKLGGN